MAEQGEALRCSQAPHAQRHDDVVEDRQMGIERVGLEDHGNVALLGPVFGYVAVRNA